MDEGPDPEAPLDGSGTGSGSGSSTDPEGFAEELLLEHTSPRGGALPSHYFLNGPFVWLLIGEAIAAIATWALLAAEFSDAAFRYDASPTQLFILWAAYSAPFIILTPFQSLVVDRWSPKWMNFGGYILTLLAIWPAMAGHSVEALYVSMFALGIANASIQPARSALTGLIVEERDLVRANGMLGAGLQVAGILGPLVGGILIGASGESTGVYILAFASSVIALPFFAMVRDARHGADVPPMRFRDLADGMVSTVRHTELRILLYLSFSMFVALAVFVALEPLLIRNTMHLEQQAVSFIWAANAVGALIGSLELTRTKERRGGELPLIGVAFVIAGTGLLIYVGFATYALAIVGSVIAGVGFSRFFAPSLALIQRVSSPEERGRVTAVFSILEEAMGMAASVVFALLAIRASAVRPVMIGMSVLLLASGLVAISALRRRGSAAP
jgi:MFS family permease